MFWEEIRNQQVQKLPDNYYPSYKNFEPVIENTEFTVGSVIYDTVANEEIPIDVKTQHIAWCTLLQNRCLKPVQEQTSKARLTKNEPLYSYGAAHRKKRQEDSMRQTGSQLSNQASSSLKKRRSKTTDKSEKSEVQNSEISETSSRKLSIQEIEKIIQDVREKQQVDEYEKYIMETENDLGTTVKRMGFYLPLEDDSRRTKKQKTEKEPSVILISEADKITKNAQLLSYHNPDKSTTVNMVSAERNMKLKNLPTATTPNPKLTTAAKPTQISETEPPPIPTPVKIQVEPEVRAIQTQGSFPEEKVLSGEEGEEALSTKKKKSVKSTEHKTKKAPYELIMSQGKRKRDSHTQKRKEKRNVAPKIKERLSSLWLIESAGPRATKGPPADYTKSHFQRLTALKETIESKNPKLLQRKKKMELTESQCEVPIACHKYDSGQSPNGSCAACARAHNRNTPSKEKHILGNKFFEQDSESSFDETISFSGRNKLSFHCLLDVFEELKPDTPLEKKSGSYSEQKSASAYKKGLARMKSLMMVLPGEDKGTSIRKVLTTSEPLLVKKKKSRKLKVKRH